MFTAIRVILGLGLLVTLGYTVIYLLAGHQRHLVIALRWLIVCVLAAVFLGLGIWIEHTTR